ncbi:FMN-binding protein [Streptomyces puniciscabiei]|uniref:FMN-binding protein n=1 Tax=Streptomyces puniciscabiei TaxID=164348 RepID=A0A542U9Q3_9ACTN|nr:FMN-binding protein [Streptomyces puniciscabiei]TQK95813.1 FMN-binding protein [Streptomyces puniciscabiei]
MKRAIPVFVLTVAGLIPVWRYHPSTGTVDTAQPASTPTAMPSAAASSPAASSSAASSSRVVQGTAVSTTKGVFQVEVTFRGDRIAAVRMLQAPHHPQTRWAVPELVAETLKAQSAHIDSVSGATITSQGYKESLQAAIDAKGT